MKTRLTYLVLGLLVVSWTSAGQSYEKFQEWYSVNKNSLELSQDVNELSYSIRFMPKELTILREVRGKKDLSRAELNKLNEKYDGFYEFSFKVQSLEVQDILASISDGEEDYNSRLFYLIESIGQDFTLVTRLGELKPLRCSFENNYGTAPFITFHLVFEHAPKNIMQQLAYNDQFFGCGNLMFELEEIEQLNIPKIK